MERKDKMLMKKKIHNKRKLAWSLFLVVVLTSLLPYLASHNFVTSKKSEEKNEGAVKAMAVDPDDFFILEVVPVQGYGSFGYLVGGQEPIDLEKLAADDKAEEFIKAFGANPLYDLVTEYSNKDKPGDGYVAITQGDDEITYTSGYYKRVLEGEGDFYLTDDGKFEVEPLFGTYKWVKAENTKKVPLNQLDENDVWRENETLPKFKYKKDILVSKDYFKKISLGNPNAKVVVKTVMPGEITEEDIKRANLITFSNGNPQKDKMVSYWNSYGIGKMQNAVTGKTFGSEDMPWSQAVLIFNRVIGRDGKSLPIVLDSTMYNSTIDKNYKKLYFMIKKMNPLVFYNLYLNDNTSGGGEPVTTLINNEGKFNNSLNWNESAFTQVESLRSLYGYVGNVGNSKNGVLSNVYTYGGNSNNPKIDMTQIINLIEGTGCVKKDAYSTEFFEYMDKNKSEYESKNGSTSPAYALKYIIGYDFSGTVNDKDTIRILDLEPGNAFSKSSVDFRKMVPTFTGSILITKQTTATFNGKIEDLNKEYDMIYLGLDVNGSVFNLDTNGITKYNDSKLYGMIYLHVGDLVIGKTTTNRLPSANNYSTADMNNFPVNWLKDVDILDAAKCRLPGNDITNLKKKQLQDFVKAGYPVVVAPDLYQKNTAKVDSTSYIYKFIDENRNAGKTNLLNENDVNTQNDKMLAKFLAIIKPTLVVTKEPVPYDPKNVDDVINNVDSLYINGGNISNRTVTFEFQLKENSIGSHEQYKAVFMVDRNADGKFSEQNEVVRTFNNISLGYTKLSFSLDEKFTGAIPWKLMVANVDNPAIRTERIGLSAIKKADSQRETINVLQINSEKGKLNLSDDDRFDSYMRNLNDFAIKIVTMTKSDVEKLFEGSGNAFDKNNPKTDKFSDYHMIIFGFADMYTTISEDNGAIENIKYFIDQGKSVLFTHDVTSFNNMDSYYKEFGYTFNKNYRGYLSMDRFGARINHGDVSAKTPRDFPYVANGGGSLYSSKHGYTAWALRRIGGKVGTGTNRYGPYPDFSFKDSNLETTRVSRVNTGQITNYPYKIDENFTVARTHPQYFQLDLEDENVVVWYCLADDNNPNNRDNGNKEPNGKYYDKSPNDASNNYYIYNKGNVTYSGVGHSLINNTLDHMEVQLFVNTMVAAYKAADKPPSAEVTNVDAIKSGEEYYLYVNSDYGKKDFKDDMYLDVNFIPFENSLLSERMKCNITFEDLPDSEKSAFGNPTVYEKGTTNPIEGEIVRSGHEYTVKYPLKLLNDKNNRKIVISLENEKGKVGKTDVYLIRRSIFELD